MQFREIAFLAVLKFFSSSKIDFWPFLKLQRMDFGQTKICENDLFDFTSFFLAWTFFNFLAHCAWHCGNPKIGFRVPVPPLIFGLLLCIF